MADAFDQHGYRVRLEWGQEGVTALAPACAVLIVVDVLSFSTAVDIALSRGATVLPLRHRETTAPPGTVPASRDRTAGWSLSPAGLLDLPPGTRLALPSPNGATLSAMAAALGTTVLAGCLRNAPAVAARAVELAAGGPIGVVPGGERWPTERTLRPALEDLLGAGAVITALLDLLTPAAAEELVSPEGLAAADAFTGAVRRGLAPVLAGCSSGRELIGWGCGADVVLAADHGVSDLAPLLVDGEYRR